MTAIDIDAIRKLADAATEGPWNVGVRWFDGMDNIPINAKGSDPDDPHQPDRIALIRYDAGGFQFPHADAKADAAFIAAARTIVPALCDELEQTRAALTASRENAANLANENGRLVAENARLRALVAKVEEIGRALDQTDEKNVRMGCLNEQYHGYGARLLYAVGDVRAAGVAR